jgi:hypothetical protein
MDNETPQSNPVLCMLESAAIRASVNPALAGQAVMLRNLAAVLRDNPVMAGRIDRLMVAKLREVAGMPTGKVHRMGKGYIDIPEVS